MKPCGYHDIGGRRVYVVVLVGTMKCAAAVRRLVHCPAPSRRTAGIYDTRPDAAGFSCRRSVKRRHVAALFKLKRRVTCVSPVPTTTRRAPTKFVLGHGWKVDRLKVTGRFCFKARRTLELWAAENAAGGRPFPRHWRCHYLKKPDSVIACRHGGQRMSYVLLGSAAGSAA
jgi:hypothetical protein